MEEYKFSNSWDKYDKTYKGEYIDADNMPVLKEQYQRIDDNQFTEFITKTKIKQMGYDFKSTPGKEFQFEFKGVGDFTKIESGFKVVGKKGGVKVEYNQIHDVLFVDEKGKKIFDLKDIKGNNLLVWVVE